MKEVILHIGAHKTGTTSLQEYLSLNRDVLENNKIHYPRFAKTHDYHHLLLRPITERKKNDFIWDIDDHCEFETVEDFKEYFKGLFESGIERLIISSELLFLNKPLFSNVVTDVDLAAYTSQLFDGVYVRPVVYLRNPIDWIESCYVEAVKGPHTCFSDSFEVYWESVKDFIYYDDYLRPWLNQYVDLLEIYIYESVLNEYDDIISHFMCEVVNANADDLVAFSNVSVKNPSLSKEFVDLLKHFNKINERQGENEKYSFPYSLKDILENQWHGKGRYFTADQSKELLRVISDRLSRLIPENTLLQMRDTWLPMLNARPSVLENEDYDKFKNIIIKQLCKINNKLDITEHKRIQLSDELDIKCDEVHQLQKILAIKNDEIADLVKRSNIQLDEIDSLVKRSDTQLLDINNLVQRSDNQLMEINNLVKRSDGYIDDIKHLAAKSEGYLNQIISLTSQLNELQKSHNKIQDDYESLRMEKCDVEKAFEAKSREFDIVVKKVRSIKESPFLFFVSTFFGREMRK